jgi:hypothetical protein
MLERRASYWLVGSSYEYARNYFNARQGAKLRKRQRPDVSNPHSISALQTAPVTMSLVSFTNAQLIGGAQYYTGSWRTIRLWPLVDLVVWKQRTPELVKVRAAKVARGET